jgi:hypothetical protein
VNRIQCPVRLSQVGVLLAVGCALLAVPPNSAALAGHLAHPRGWLNASGPDGAVIELAAPLLWMVGCWLELALCSILAATLPGAAGRVGRRVGATITPPLLARLLSGAVGAGVVLSPVATAWASPSPPASAGIAIGWPTDSPTPALGSSPTPPFGQPVSPPHSVHLSTQPGRPAGSPLPRRPTPTAPEPAAPGPAGPVAGGVTVRAGDSLWLIAAHRLGATAADSAIAAEWPRWYAANRTLVGPDPALITPGTHLSTPISGG